MNKSIVDQSRATWTHDLSRSEPRFLAAINEVNFGRFECLRIQRGELVLDPWDGTKRINNWLTLYLGTEPSEYARAVDAKFLIGGVVRIYKPGVGKHLNFSAISKLPAAQQRAVLFEPVNEIQLGAMPLPASRFVHPGSVVSPQQLAALKQYLKPATLNKANRNY
jgi:hypothetical protein